MAAPSVTATPGVDAEGQPATGSAEEILPRHVAIIMDGNRRWARERGLSDADGHAAGVEAIRPIVERARQRGVRVLSLFAFSRENWSRSRHEVETLIALLDAAIRDYTSQLIEQGVRVRLLGRLDELPAATEASIMTALEATAEGKVMDLVVAFNYSSRSEIADAVRSCLEAGLAPESLDERSLADHLYTRGLPDPDLLIRTGGEKRISNFLLWQAAYAELYFCDTYWPDFSPESFDAALREFARRTRRFGR